MKTNLKALLLSALIAFSASLPSFADTWEQYGRYGTENFTYRYDYDGRFADVGAGDWFYPSVVYTYELGLMRGKSDSEFAPGGSVTHAEIIVLLARLYTIYYGFGDGFAQGSPWYQPYVDFCVGHGLISGEGYDAGRLSSPAPRSWVIGTLYSMKDEFFNDEINSVEDGAIPDVRIGGEYGGAIYAAYRCGIAVGSDASGTFFPDSYVTRAETAAIISRLTDAGLRRTVTLRLPEKTAEPAGGRTDNTVVDVPAGASIETMIDACRLVPTKTGYTPLDDAVEKLFGEIFTPGMKTSEKVKTCYDWLIDNCSYGSSGSFDHMSILLINPYLYPENGGYVRGGTTNFITYDTAASVRCAEALSVSDAMSIFTDRIGVCDNWSSAFALMMRAIGLPCTPAACQAKNGSSYGGHLLTVMTFNGVDYVFDPQIEQVIADSYGYCYYGRYGKSLESLGDRYIDVKIDQMRDIFGEFRYDETAMEQAVAGASGEAFGGGWDFFLDGSW